ncbi:MAG TPA: ketol-acid reductoisomerase [Euryarchaeota archaeon]|nr:ketol-acid reductoisomerase [archaeon BMS3Abin16]GBE56181.1 ketol-acid reductoisomerase [archaeon BMS3Bbin16]HDH28030.1 ketol-acid reductoisomerase [Euryarchaeota archaeon]HDY74487.1 ketol-acid reductoisomerase [Euryarchaeota archaeon]
MTRIYYDKDIDIETLKDETIAVIGYGIQGHAQAQNMRDSGLNVICGLREGGGSWKKASEAGFDVMPISEAAAKADIIHILIPDEKQPEVYEKHIKSGLSEGNALSFSHGFNIRFNQIVPPENVDVIMMAPKGPGAIVRREYTEGFGVPALVAVEQDFTGRAKNRALAMAKANGASRAGVLETAFAEETETDLFGEQVDLCGGCAELITASFETLVDAGYQPEIAYFECLHELKLIVDLIYSKGIEGMWENVSNTAEYGGRTRAKRIINKESRKAMKEILAEIQTDKFAEEWISEDRSGLKNLEKLREKGKTHQIESVGARLRKLMKRG